MCESNKDSEKEMTEQNSGVRQTKTDIKKERQEQRNKDNQQTDRQEEIKKENPTGRLTYGRNKKETERKNKQGRGVGGGSVQVCV